MKNLPAWLNLFIFLFLSVLRLNGQILEYSFDYESNDIIKDVGILRNHGEIIGTAEYVEDKYGNECRALNFDGNTYVSIANHASLNFKDEFSLSVWLKLENDDLDWITLICKGNTPEESLNSPSFRVQLTNRTASFNTKSTKDIGIVDLPFPNNQWFHLVVTYSAFEAKIYINSIPKKVFNIYAPLGYNSQHLEIGRDVPGSLEMFRGIMDELKIYDKVLNDKEVSSLYNSNFNMKSTACPPATIQPFQSPIDFDWAIFEIEEENEGDSVDLSWSDFNEKDASTSIEIDWSSFEELHSETTKSKLNDSMEIDWSDFALEEQTISQSIPITKKSEEDLSEANAAYRQKLAELNIQEKFVTNAKAVSITLYDHKIVDSDTVNIYLNDSLIVKGHQLKSISNKQVIQIPIKFSKSYESEFVSIEAVNFGETGVKMNTVAISIYDGKNVYLKELVLRKLYQKVTLEILFKS